MPTTVDAPGDVIYCLLNALFCPCALVEFSKSSEWNYNALFICHYLPLPRAPLPEGAHRSFTQSGEVSSPHGFLIQFEIVYVELPSPGAHDQVRKHHRHARHHHRDLRGPRPPWRKEASVLGDRVAFFSECASLLAPDCLRPSPIPRRPPQMILSRHPPLGPLHCHEVSLCAKVWPRLSFAFPPG